MDLSRELARQHGVKLVETEDGHRLAHSLPEILEALEEVIHAADGIAEQRFAFEALRGRYPEEEAEAELQRVLAERE